MKKFKVIILACTLMLFAAACNTNQNRSATPAETETTEESRFADNTQYTCPMHPEVLSDQMGDCPKCGMKLVETDSVNAPDRDTL